MKEIIEFRDLLFNSIKTKFDEEFHSLDYIKTEEIKSNSFKIEYKKKNRIIKFDASLFPTDYPYYLSIKLIKKKILSDDEIPFWFILKTKSNKNIDFVLTDDSEYLSKNKIDELLTNIKNELFHLCEKFVNGNDVEFANIYKKFKKYKIELEKNTI